MRNFWNYLAGSACYLLLPLLILSLESRLSAVETHLEQILSDTSILNTQQIKIPGYPNAYNPSLIPYKGGYLLSFRFISRCPKEVGINSRTNVSFVGVAKLGENFTVSEKSVQLLNIVSHSSKFSLTAEDARLLCVGSRIFIFFNDLPALGNPGSFAMYFGEVIENRGVFSLKEPAKLLNYPFTSEIEKNWSPFVSGDRLYLIYSDQPRVILEVDLNTGYCQEVSRTPPNGSWDLGEIRGGTPAYFVNDSFLTFFHSSFPGDSSKGKVYVMGAYTFDKEPPFSIRKITTAPLGTLTYYTNQNASKVVFPGGMVVQDGFIHVAWGKGDKQIYITTFDKDKLFSSMEPCFE